MSPTPPDTLARVRPAPRLGFFSRLLDEVPAGERYRLVTEQIAHAEAQGFDSAWIAQHHFHESEGGLPSPFVFLSHVAARTRRIRLGTGVVTLPLENALRVAEDAAVLGKMLVKANEIAVELLKGLEVGEYEFSKYIPEYLGQAALYLYPSELDEQVLWLKTLLGSPNDSAVSGALNTIGVLLQHYPAYRERFSQSSQSYEDRRQELLGLLLQGLAHYREAVRPSDVELKDYSFKTPAYGLSHKKVGAELTHQRDTYQHFDYPGRYKADPSGKAFAQHRLDALRNDAVAGSGKSNSAALLPGQSFSLTEHPNGSLNTDWQIVRIQHTGLQPQALEEEGGSGPTVYHNEFGVVKASTTWRARIGSPQAPHKPMVDGPQIAMVVGPDGEEIYCDEHGRVKLQFPWDRYGSSNDQSSCWVRVSQGWAGGQYGMMAIPRIGHEVIVQFINADPDLPIITGRLSNPTQMPPWQLPSQHALSGFRSKEIHGSQYNKLILDDTTEQIQAQLGSDADTSELSLGHITRIADNAGRTDHRGQGFELRTDGHGVTRAASGLLVTTYSGDAHLTELSATAQLLEQAHSQQHGQRQSAMDHKADERSMAQTADEALKEQNQTIAGTGKQDELNAPQLVLSAPAGMAIATPQTIHLATPAHHAVTAHGDLSMSVGKRLIASVGKGINLFAQSLGFKAMAAKGKVQIQAQSDEVEFIAEQVLRIISAKKSITFAAAEEILVTAGGSYFKINGAGIEHGTTGNYTIYAAQHPFTGPNQMEYEMPKEPLDEMFVIRDQHGPVVPNFKYKIVTDSGRIYRGVTNERGETLRIGTGVKVVNLRVYADDASTDE